MRFGDGVEIGGRIDSVIYLRGKVMKHDVFGGKRDMSFMKVDED